jgi:HEPN domain-containing protein
MPGMNRQEFQSLAFDRLADADALLSAGRHAGAYYVSGYAVECALKACIARRTKQDEFPPKEAPTYYVHDLAKLRSIAGLDAAFEDATKQDPALRTNWALVKDWSEKTRYESRGKQQADELLAAINDPQHGVLQWLRKSW